MLCKEILRVPVTLKYWRFVLSFLLKISGWMIPLSKKTTNGKKLSIMISFFFFICKVSHKNLIEIIDVQNLKLSSCHVYHKLIENSLKLSLATFEFGKWKKRVWTSHNKSVKQCGIPPKTDNNVKSRHQKVVVGNKKVSMINHIGRKCPLLWQNIDTCADYFFSNLAFNRLAQQIDCVVWYIQTKSEWKKKNFPTYRKFFQLRYLNF